MSNLRDFIKIFEEILPGWYAAGDIVNIFDDKWDATEFLEGNEFDYEWRFCMVPATIVEPNLLPPEISDNRKSDIRSWAGTNLSNLLKEQPPIAIYDEQEIHILDGNHRASVALEERLPYIPMLVAIGKMNTPDP